MRWQWWLCVTCPNYFKRCPTKPIKRRPWRAKRINWPMRSLRASSPSELCSIPNMEIFMPTKWTDLGTQTLWTTPTFLAYWAFLIWAFVPKTILSIRPPAASSSLRAILTIPSSDSHGMRRWRPPYLEASEALILVSMSITFPFPVPFSLFLFFSFPSFSFFLFLYSLFFFVLSLFLFFSFALFLFFSFSFLFSIFSFLFSLFSFLFSLFFFSVSLILFSRSFSLFDYFQFLFLFPISDLLMKYRKGAYLANGADHSRSYEPIGWRDQSGAACSEDCQLQHQRIHSRELLEGWLYQLHPALVRLGQFAFRGTHPHSCSGEALPHLLTRLATPKAKICYLFFCALVYR